MVPAFVRTALLLNVFDEVIGANVWRVVPLAVVVIAVGCTFVLSYDIFISTPRAAEPPVFSVTVTVKVCPTVTEVAEEERERIAVLVAAALF